MPYPSARFDGQFMEKSATVTFYSMNKSSLLVKIPHPSQPRFKWKIVEDLNESVPFNTNSKYLYITTVPSLDLNVSCSIGTYFPFIQDKDKNLLVSVKLKKTEVSLRSYGILVSHNKLNLSYLYKTGMKINNPAQLNEISAILSSYKSSTTIIETKSL